MNFELSATNLSELEQIITTLFAESKCACHVINPHKTRILLWKEVKNGLTTYYLRIGIQKFISQEQTDRNGEIYWKFQTYLEVKKSGEEKAESENKETAETETLDKTNLSKSPSEPDAITKFNQRQIKTEAINHGKSNNCPE